MGELRVAQLCKKIGAALIKNGFNIVSGFGFGVGDNVIIGALQALYATPKGRERDRVILKPFPRSPFPNISQSSLNTKHREELLSRSGMVIYICGNREQPRNSIIVSPGVLEEFDIAARMGRPPIPIGSSGHAAAEIWRKVRQDQSIYFGKGDFSAPLNTLNSSSATDDEIVDAVIAMAKELSSGLT
jgi:hypothetical protein